jgi:hypothetical protein
MPCTLISQSPRPHELAEIRAEDEFLLDLEAQLERAGRSLALITAEFEQTDPGSDLSRSARMETKEFISSIKHVLDQLTAGVWRNVVYPELLQEVGESDLRKFTIRMPQTSKCCDLLWEK